MSFWKTKLSCCPSRLHFCNRVVLAAAVLSVFIPAQMGVTSLIASPESPTRVAAVEYFAPVQAAQSTCIRSYNGAFESYRKNAYTQALTQFKEALACYRSLNQPEGAAECLKMIGEVNRLLKKFSESISALESALQYFSSEVTNPKSEADTYRLLAWTYHDSQSFNKAVQLFGKAQRKYHNLGNPDGEARCYFGLGLTHVNAKTYSPAIEAFQNASALFKRLNEREREIDCLYYIGQCQYELGQSDLAKESLNKAVGSLSDRTKLANANFWIGNIHFAEKRYLKAFAAFDTAEDLFRQMNELVFLAHCTFNRGLCQFNLNDWKAAVPILNQAAETYRQQGKYKSAVSSLTYVGHANFNQERFPVAVDAYQEAAQLAQRHNFSSEEATAQTGLGDTYRAMQIFDSAVAGFLRAARLYESIGQHARALDNYVKAGEVNVLAENYSGAISAYRDAIRLSSGLPESRLKLATTRFSLAELFRMTEQPRLALDEYERALNIYHEYNISADTLAKCLDGLGHCNFDVERYPEAAVHFQDAAVNYESGGDINSAGLAYFNAGLSQEHSRKYAEALRNYEIAANLFDQVEDRKSQADSHKRIASIKKIQGLPRVALELLSDALGIYRSLADTSAEAECYLDMGETYVELSPPDYSSAQLSYKNAENLYLQLENELGRARSHRGLASVHFDLREYARSMAAYQDAGETFEQHGQRSDAALCFQNAGSAALNLEQYQRAYSFYMRVLDRQHELEDKERVARCQKLAADCLVSLFRFEEAWRSYEEALKYYDSVKDYAGLFECLIGFGDVYSNQARYSEAISRYEEALSRTGPYIETELRVRAHNRIAQAGSALGDFDLALDHWNRIYDIHVIRNDSVGQLEILLRQAGSFYQRDRYEQALEYLQQVLDRTQDYTGDEEKEAELYRMALISRANVYEDIGADSLAMQDYRRALQLSRATDDSVRVSASLNGIANGQMRAQKYHEALQNYLEVKTISEDLEDTRGLAVAYLNIGNVYNGWQQFGLAFEHYSRSKELCEEIQYTKGLSIAYNNLGIVELNRGSNHIALQHFQHAETEAQKFFIKRLLITIYSNQGVTHERMAQGDKARVAYEKALELVQQIRGTFKKEELMKSYIESTAELYDRMISLLFEQGETDLAYRYIDHSRSSGIIESYKAKALAASDKELLEKLSELEQLLNRKQVIETAVAEGQSSQLKRVLIEELARTSQQATALERELRLKYSDYTDFMRIDAAEIAAIQDLIPDDAVVVSYYPGEEKLYVYVASRVDYRATAIGISRDSLYHRIRHYRSVIEEQVKHAVDRFGRLNKNDPRILDVMPVNSWTQPSVQPLTSVTTDLHEYLIAPIENELSSASTIIFIPSGLLYYLPLHALGKMEADTLNFVIERWTVAYLTSTTFARNIGRVGKMSRKACLERVVGLGYSSGNLTGVEVEMNSLRQFASNPNLRVYLEEEATERRAKELGPESCVLVLSGHCKVNVSNTDDTHILLAAGGGEDGRLSTNEIEELRDELGGLTKMNLAILPNCATAVGEKNPIFGVRNLVQSFSQAGAASVLATLWPVADAFTPILMHEFYKNFFELGFDKAESIRNAQRSLLSEPRTRHPFFWAGFLLYGYWYGDVIQVSQKSGF